MNPLLSPQSPQRASKGDQDDALSTPQKDDEFDDLSSPHDAGKKSCRIPSDGEKLTQLLSMDSNAHSAIFTRFRSPTRGTFTNTLSTITKLDLPNCGLDENSLPSSLASSLPTLKILFFFKNKFTKYPAVLGECENLTMVSFKLNQIEEIEPEALQPQLRWLILTGNKLRQLPDAIGRCTNLQKLMLSGNNLSSLPGSISKCTNLELVRLACNDLQEAPLDLLSLPKLAWVALASNPFLADLASTHLSPDVIAASDLEAGASNKAKVLGSGASGTTVQMTMSSSSPPGPVAVKKYSSMDITSDGSPSDEFKASLFAGSLSIPSVVKALGVTYPTNGSSSDDTTPDLVMELLSGYSALGNPPSMTTCTRDTYSPTLTLLPTVAHGYAVAAGRALTTFHASGLCHGDFYSHNILVADDGDSKLTDFGAAFFYDKSKPEAELVQRCELRAYRIWLDEIIGMVDFDKSNQWEMQAFNDLKDLADDLAKPGATFTSAAVYPRLYKCKPEAFRVWPKPLRFMTGYATATLFTASFLSLPILSLLAIPACWKTYEARLASTFVLAAYAFSFFFPSREWPAFRKVGQLWYEMFDVSCNMSAEQRKRAVKMGQADTKYIIGMHPHGIIPLQAVVWSAYCDQYFHDPITGENLYGFGAAADVVKYLPFLRNMMAWLSAGSASYDTLYNGLEYGEARQCNANNNRRPRHLYLLPGGVAEVFESTVGHNAIVFKHRRGLVKLALETGADLLPCYVFGGTDFFHNLATGTNLLARLSRKIKAGVTVFWGYFLLPLPFLPKVTLCIADPIEVEKWDKDKGEIPAELIEEIHAKYLASIVDLFEKHKAVAGYPDATLLVK